MKKATVIFIILIIIVIAGFFAFWYYRNSVFSKEILKLEILGPDAASVGNEIEYTVKYKNNGNFVLEQPKLTFQLPKDSLSEDGKTLFAQDLKDIYPGDENTVTFRARLLGKEGDLKTATAYLSYVPKNLSARYESDTTFTTKIDKVPVTLGFDLPTKVEQGKEMQYAVNYFSNIDYPLENLSIKINPTNGFAFSSADSPTLDNIEWKLKTLNKAQGGRITVRGIVTAAVGSDLNLSATLGMWQNGQFIPVKQINQDVQVIEPQLFISEQINGSNNYVPTPGEVLHYEIFLRNIGSTPFDNLFIVSRLGGSVFDLSTLKSDEGQVRVNDGLIAWDSKLIPRLAHLGSQQEESVKFDVKLKDSWTPTDSDKNSLIIKNTVNASGISQEFDTKLNSQLVLSQIAYYSTILSGINFGSIQNSGPLPPRVGATTTYTVNWQVKNYFNDVKNVKVKAVLPAGVSLTGQTYPESQLQNFSMDSNSKEIVWSVGDLVAGAGINSSGPSVSFQISFTPNLSQRQSVPSLVGSATISGDDQFSGNTIRNGVPAIDTSLPNDQANSGKGTVQ